MRNSYCVGGLFLLSLLMTIPLFHGKIIQGHDTQYAFIETVSMYQSWTYGDFVGRWTPDILHGYGYPSLNYYPPLFSYITAALSMVLHNLIWGFNLGLFLTLFASGCAMYLYAKEFWGIEGGFLSAVAYLFAPYHIVDLYVRGACAEFTSFIFIPLSLYAFHRLSIAPKTFYFLMAIMSLAGLTLSHNIMAMFCYPLLFVYALVIITQKKFNARWAILYGLIFATAIALTSFFTVPALKDRAYVQIDRISKDYDFHQHFLYWDQLLYCPWGNGGSGPLRTDDAMSFQIGPLHLLLVLILLIRLGQIKFKRPESWAFIKFWLIIAVIASLMTLRISVHIWETIPILSMAAFPWRFLLLITLAVSFLAGGACTVFKQSRMAICLLGTILIIAGNIFYCHDFGYLDLSIKSPKEFLESSTPMENMAFLPKDVKILRLIPSKDKLEVIQGEGKILDCKSSSGLQYSYTFLASTPTLLFFHSFYFPGWKVMIDKENTPILSDNPFGLIAFIIPAGRHLVEINFQNTPIHTLFQRLSLGVLLILILLFLFRRKIDALLQVL